MNKICTSLEQSQKLIELGIDVNTADMYWDYDYDIQQEYKYCPRVMDEQFGVKMLLDAAFEMVCWLLENKSYD